MKLASSPIELESFCSEAAKFAKYIAIDTEFVRQNTYYAKVCLIQIAFKTSNKKKILLIDDINRGGDAMSWIIDDWQDAMGMVGDYKSESWHTNVRFSSLIDNPNSKVPMDYCNEEIDLDEEEIWVEFPWES